MTGVPAVVGSTAIVVGRYPLDTGAWFPAHSHPQSQVLWSPRGVVGVAVADQQWVLPPTRALWMPSGVVHRTGASRKALLTGIYLADGHGSPDWRRPTVLAAGALFAELIGYLGRDDLGERRRAHAEAVLLDVLEPLPAAPLEVRIPADPRAAAVANALREDPSDRRGLAGFARLAGTSPRTLSRLFVAETGTSFERWRTNLRMWTALPLLAEGEPVSRVAHAVGYATASAFLAAFRRTVGMPPGAYLSETMSASV
ncbi:helix-turn-helix domain-containing protein [Pseudonocardia acaciae]|uniref:helix-turn-helix domain-containing protein n=1 Tax=Pseudonocardia acaciae TaxID=551276 RepID=UPI0004920DF8|nr:helix-turn-helix transcriptional regulator [Pseudonocardia acaciae]